MLDSNNPTEKLEEGFQSSPKRGSFWEKMEGKLSPEEVRGLEEILSYIRGEARR